MMKTGKGWSVDGFSIVELMEVVEEETIYRTCKPGIKVNNFPHSNRDMRKSIIKSFYSRKSLNQFEKCFLRAMVETQEDDMSPEVNQIKKIADRRSHALNILRLANDYLEESKRSIYGYEKDNAFNIRKKYMKELRKKSKDSDKRWNNLLHRVGNLYEHDEKYKKLFDMIKTLMTEYYFIEIV